jgi:two-component system, chemotaxis family, CheB/CheR fusion protein
LRILVADDVRDAAEALSILLKIEGHEVSVALGGSEAIALAQSVRPDVAVLDIGMPTVDGYEVARTLRREEWGEAIHLIALTGRDDNASKKNAAAAGFQRYVVKPIHPIQFLELISEINVSKGVRRSVHTG